MKKTNILFAAKQVNRKLRYHDGWSGIWV